MTLQALDVFHPKPSAPLFSSFSPILSGSAARRSDQLLLVQPGAHQQLGTGHAHETQGAEDGDVTLQGPGQTELDRWTWEQLKNNRFSWNNIPFQPLPDHEIKRKV